MGQNIDIAVKKDGPGEKPRAVYIHAGPERSGYKPKKREYGQKTKNNEKYYEKKFLGNYAPRAV
jgi:hypothetical protein